MSIRTVQQGQWPSSGRHSANHRAELLDGSAGGRSDGN